MSQKAVTNAEHLFADLPALPVCRALRVGRGENLSHGDTQHAFLHVAGSVGGKIAVQPGGTGGRRLYLSGALGNKPGTREVVPGGLAAETKQTMDNIGAVLAANGLGFDDVFKCTVMLADMDKWEDFNKVYVTYFKPGRLPARSAFGASALALGAQVELECWAYAGKT